MTTPTKEALAKVLTSRFTDKQYNFIKANPKKSGLLRELLQAHIDEEAANEEA